MTAVLPSEGSVGVVDDVAAEPFEHEGVDVGLVSSLHHLYCDTSQRRTCKNESTHSVDSFCMVLELPMQGECTLLLLCFLLF